MERVYHQLMERNKILKVAEVNQEVILEEPLAVIKHRRSQASKTNRTEVRLSICISTSRISNSSLMQVTSIHLPVLKMVSRSEMVEVALSLEEVNKHHRYILLLKSSNLLPRSLLISWWMETRDHILPSHLITYLPTQKEQVACTQTQCRARRKLDIMAII